MSSAKLVVSIGIPGSGKTTFLNNFKKFPTVAYICPDDIRQEITGSASNQGENSLVWKITEKRVLKALEKESCTILDSTLTDVSVRSKYIEIGTGFSIPVIGLFFEIPLGVALTRNELRDRVVPESVIESMFNNLCKYPPSLEEGFTHLIQIRDGMDSDVLKSILQFI